MAISLQTTKCPFQYVNLGDLEISLKAFVDFISIRFAVDLLQQVRTTTELHTILNYDPEDEENLVTRKQLARLELAIQYKQKTFVAHSHVQQLLAAIW